MNLGFLVLPALVGFLFLIIGNQTRFSLMRLSGYQVVFVSALVGTSFLIVARVLVLLLDGRCVALESTWSKFAPFNYSGTVGVSTALALSVAALWNWMTDKEAAARRSAARSGNQILWLLRDSLAKNRMVEVTLRSSKCYVGYTQDTGITTHRADPDITLIPMASGFRDQETRELALTTFYGERVEEFLNSQGEESLWRFEDFQVAFPFSEIVSARFFDPAVFAKFQSPPDDQGCVGSVGRGDDSDGPDPD